MVISIADNSASGILVTVGGKTFTGFETARLSATLEHAARSFDLQIAAENGGAATIQMFKAGAKVSITVAGEPFLTGFVDRYRPRIGKAEFSVSISGRSKGADAIDCSVIHATGNFQNRTPLQIAQELDKFGVGFTASGDLKPVLNFQVSPGETVFQALSRLARDQNLTLRSKGDGGIEFYNAKKSPKRQAGPLIEGRNILSGEADHDWSKRYSKYHVRGQKAVGTDEKATQLESVAEDTGVDRYRPTVILAEGDTDEGRICDRAQHHRNRKAGRGLSADITVVGFRDSGGKLWEPGNLVYVESDALSLGQDMMIEGVDFSEDSSGGLVAKLKLCDPKAHAGKKRKVAKKQSGGGMWDFSNE